MIILRSFLLIGMVFAAPMLTAMADDLACDGRFDGKTVTFIVPFAVGGGYDAYARIFASNYETVTGARVALQNLGSAKGLPGARKLRDAAPDGLTLGIENASRRIIGRLLDDYDAPDILTDFTILGRIARSRQVIITGQDSPYRSFGDLLQADSPPVYGANNLRTGGFMTMALLTSLTDFDFDVVAGIGGTRKRLLAVSRGDVDITSSNFYSVVSDIEAGLVRPLLQIADSPIDAHPSLDDIPVLGGPNGIVAERARDADNDVEAALERVGAVFTLTGAGRLILAPAGLDAGLADCLANAVQTTLNSDTLAADLDRVQLGKDVAPGAETREELETSLPVLTPLAPIILQRIEQATK